MPKSTITSTDVDTKSFKIYSEKDHAWNRLTLKDYNVSLNKLKQDAKKKALDFGILDKADSQAKLLITNFIHGFPDTNDYTIDFQ